MFLCCIVSLCLRHFSNAYLRQKTDVISRNPSRELHKAWHWLVYCPTLRDVATTCAMHRKIDPGIRWWNSLLTILIFDFHSFNWIVVSALLLNRLQRGTVWTIELSIALSWIGFQTNLPGTACILMLWAYPPVYLCLHWIQGTFRAERACLICVSHDNNTATIDERSCGNLLQATTGEYGARETE